MRIDVHAHYWTDDYLDRLVELGQTDTACSVAPVLAAAQSLMPGCV